VDVVATTSSPSLSTAVVVVAAAVVVVVVVVSSVVSLSTWCRWRMVLFDGSTSGCDVSGSRSSSAATVAPPRAELSNVDT